jgi:hypothetical protein
VSLEFELLLKGSSLDERRREIFGALALARLAARYQPSVPGSSAQL